MSASWRELTEMARVAYSATGDDFRAVALRLAGAVIDRDDALKARVRFWFKKEKGTILRGIFFSRRTIFSSFGPTDYLVVRNGIYCTCWDEEYSIDSVAAPGELVAVGLPDEVWAEMDGKKIDEGDVIEVEIGDKRDGGRGRLIWTTKVRKIDEALLARREGA